MTLSEKLLAAIVAFFVALMAPGAVSSLDTASHRTAFLLGASANPAGESTPQDVSSNAPIAEKIRDVVDELLR